MALPMVFNIACRSFGRRLYSGKQSRIGRMLKQGSARKRHLGCGCQCCRLWLLLPLVAAAAAATAAATAAAAVAAACCCCRLLPLLHQALC